MSRPRPRLGRGLEALIPTGPEGGQTGDGLPQYIPIDQIRPSPQQQRSHFPPEQLRELADSIRQHGILQPLLVHRLPRGYELIAGERRWRAAQQAGLTRVPAIVRGEVETRESLILGLIENLQREDLDPIEEAKGIQRLLETFGFTHEEAAAQLGKSRVAISQAVRLLNGCPAVLSATSNGAITAGHARALVGLESHEDQEYGLKVVLSRRLSVRQTEKWVQTYKPQARPPRPRKASSPPEERQVDATDFAELDEIHSRLAPHFPGRASLSGSPEHGQLSINYTNREELEDLVTRLTSVPPQT
jgi:ParB family transcriptional regulator, chromosome partitioning protein